MTIAADLVQRTREAVVAILDTDDDVVSVTGRARLNVVPWDTSDDSEATAIAFMVTSSPRIGGCGERRRIVMQFEARASSEEQANTLLGLIPQKLRAKNFMALDTPLDAYLEAETRRGDGEDGREALEVVLVVSQPILTGV